MCAPMGSPFTIRAEHPAYARRIVRSTLSGAHGDAVEAAALLTSELVTNAMVLAKADPELFLDTRQGHIYVEVRESVDNSAHDPREEWTPTGWGLDMINALASSWGVESHHDGETVWFALTF
jgi:hypothetical protein